MSLFARITARLRSGSSPAGPAWPGAVPIVAALTGLALLAAAAPWVLPAARAFAPTTPDLAAAAAAGPASTAAYGARCIGPAFDDTAAFQAAIDTGHTVYAPAMGGRCHITRALVMKTPGQIFHGDGRARTKIEIAPGFSGEGVFVAHGLGPGPTWRDLSIFFGQPDTSSQSSLVRYPPAFAVRGQPAFAIDHAGCFRAIVCIDMRGNTGNSIINDFEFSAFHIGMDIDGALDSVRIMSAHWWPFYLTKNQQRLFYDQHEDRPIAISVGRADDLKISGGLFAGGLGISFQAGVDGPAFGSIEGTDFDGNSGIEISAGTIQVTACQFTIGRSDAKLVKQTGGSLDISSCYFHMGVKLKAPAIDIRNGSLVISGSHFDAIGFDNTIIDVGVKATMIMSSNIFQIGPGPDRHLPLFLSHSSCDCVVTGNVIRNDGESRGIFAAADLGANPPVFLANKLAGWRITTSNIESDKIDE